MPWTRATRRERKRYGVTESSPRVSLGERVREETGDGIREARQHVFPVEHVIGPGQYRFPALYGALDAERRRRGMSWQQVAREIGPAVSTLARTARGGPMEADGVLAMLRWLGQTFASFTSGKVPSPARTSADVVRVPGVTETRRFDARAVYTALDRRRRSLDMPWADVAREIGGCTPAMLTRLAKGGRMEVGLVVAVSAWLGRTAESFTHTTER